MELIPTAVKSIILLPLLFFAPGYLVLTLWRDRGNADDRWPLEEGLYLAVLLSVLLASWVGLTLAQMGWFAWWSLALSLAAVCAVLVGLAARSRADLGWLRTLPASRYSVALAVLVAIMIPLYFRPHQYIMGGADAGVYVNIGVNLAHTGRWTIHNDLVAEIGTEAAPEFFRAHPPGLIPKYFHLPAFYIEDVEQGRILPQFYPFQSVWMAIFATLWGIQGALLTTPLWGVMGCLAVYFAARRLFGSEVGLVAAGLLALTPTQVWFARYPTSEMLTQFLLFAFIGAFAAYVTVPEWPPLWGVLAGVTLGSALLVRADLIFILVLPVLFLIYLRLCGKLRSTHLWFFGPLLMLVLGAAFHVLVFAHSYAYNTYVMSFRRFARAGWIGVGGVGLVLGFYALLEFWPGLKRGIGDWLQRHRHWLIGAAIVVVWLSAIYAYFIRPAAAEPVITTSWYSGGQTFWFEQASLIRLGQYISPLSIVLALIGMSLILWHKLSWQTWPLLCVGLGYAYMYLYRAFANPVQIYVMRRYVPVVIPAVIICVAYTLVWLWRLPRWRPWGRALAVGTGTLLVALLVYNNRHGVLLQVDYRGAVEQIADLAATFGDDDVVLFDDVVPVGAGAVVGTPLEYIFHRHVLTLRQEQPDEALLVRLVRQWRDEGREVFLVTGDHAVPLPAFDFVPVRAWALETTMLEQIYGRRPQRVIPYRIPLAVYKFADKATARPVATIDVGALDFPYVQGGTYGAERLADGTTYRWTAQEARIILPWALSPGDTLALRLNGGRPQGVPPARVAVWLGDRKLGAFDPTGGFETYRVEVRDGFAKGTLLRLITNTWVPKEAGVNSDSRSLGVMLDWVARQERAGE